MNLVDIVTNQVATDHFTVVDNLGALVSGLVDGNFTRTLYNPSGTEVSGTVTVTITELGATGVYKLSFTPNADGIWVISIYHPTYLPAGVHQNYMASATSAASLTNLLVVATGVVGSSAATNEFIDSTRSEAQNFWKDQILMFTSGGNKGPGRRIESWDATLKKFTFVDGFPSTILPGHQYAILSFVINDVTGSDVDSAPVLDV